MSGKFRVSQLPPSKLNAIDHDNDFKMYNNSSNAHFSHRGQSYFDQVALTDSLDKLSQPTELCMTG